MNTRIDNFYYVRNYLAFFCPTNPKVCPKMADILNKVNYGRGKSLTVETRLTSKGRNKEWERAGKK